MTETSPILIIDRGDLTSLVATALQKAPERLILWHLVETDAAAHRRKEICEFKAQAMGVRRLIVSKPVPLGLPDMPPPGHLYQAMVLLQASAIAGQLDCGRIVWPRQVGPDFEQMGRLVERANLVMDLACGEIPGIGAGKGPVIDLPLVDLTDEQLVDVLEDSGHPMDLFWPCEQGAPTPCEACVSCDRWRKAYEAMGVAWPWAVGALA